MKKLLSVVFCACLCATAAHASIRVPVTQISPAPLHDSPSASDYARFAAWVWQYADWGWDMQEAWEIWNIEGRP